ncbi:hypothetical protein PCIT_a0359 [Pseudoalteromonas citrea]|uniref:Uncharacterized protein n=2 Tax=Pseudoalteromonas citrea TaxID=43655 RepID=A0AAD4AKN2_9GAMM|nr:hypothetical protein [Pseudoalteromonas citrea]KAF7773991.1 hypothetical protein PCIT_a0359 [Pseudoalteromonas citrea]
MVKKNLCDLQCPQLFVQFKWHLQQAEKAGHVIRFYYANAQDMTDVFKYLTLRHYSYTQSTTSQLFIEVNTHHV